MTSELQTHPPHPKVGKMRDNHNSRHLLCRTFCQLRPGASFSPLKTQDPPQS